MCGIWLSGQTGGFSQVITVSGHSKITETHISMQRKEVFVNRL